MKYLAILYDEQRSYVFDEVDLPKVERAMRDKLPFQFSEGTIVAGADIRRIEREYTSDSYSYPQLNQPVKEPFDWEHSHIRKIMKQRWGKHG